jgi:hypothetical protein
VNTPIRHKGLALVLGLALGGLIHAEEPKSDRNDANVLERFRIAKDGDCLLLPVKYGGKTYQFLLDTGSTCNMFDSSLSLGKPTDEALVVGFGGAVRLRLYDAPEAAVGALSLKSADPVAAFDFTMFRQVTGHEVYGVIGMPFLGRHVVRVDFDRGELLVLKEPGRDRGQGFEVTYNERALPCLTAGVAGDKRHRFQLDTGYNGTGNLATKPFDALLNDGGLKVVGTTLTQAISRTSRFRKGRLKQLSLGEFTLRGAVVSEADESYLGLGFCSRFVMTLDLANDKVYLKKGKEFGRADAYDLSGLHLLRKDGKVVVHSVDNQSPAEVAGLKAGDAVVKVDGTMAEELGLFHLRLLLSTEGKKFRVTISRDGTEAELALALSREE